MMTDRPPLLSLQAAADRLGTTARTVQRLIARGQLRKVQLPGVRRVLIDVEDLDRLVKSSKP
jgi:excisionase family DNA binding protein